MFINWTFHIIPQYYLSFYYADKMHIIKKNKVLFIPDAFLIHKILIDFFNNNNTNYTMIVNKKSKTKKTFGTVLIIMLTTSYVAGFLLASNRIISSEIILSNNIIFFSYDKPLLYGFIFAFEMTSAAIRLFIG